MKSCGGSRGRRYCSVMTIGIKRARERGRNGQGSRTRASVGRVDASVETREATCAAFSTITVIPRRFRLKGAAQVVLLVDNFVVGVDLPPVVELVELRNFVIMLVK